jgi:hypothetical protein
MAQLTEMILHKDNDYILTVEHNGAAQIRLVERTQNRTFLTTAVGFQPTYDLYRSVGGRRCCDLLWGEVEAMHGTIPRL